MLVALVLWLSAASAVSAASPPVSAARPPALFESREPLRFTFATRAKWLDFVRGLPDGAAAAEQYAVLFPEADYARYQAGTTVDASRITSRSDGLLIRGMMVAPRTPGPHP